MKGLKVILPAGEIPAGSRVRKIGGEKPYILRESIQIFFQEKDRPRQEVKAEKGLRFLVPMNDMAGTVNAISVGTELVWLVEDSEFRDWIDDLYDEGE